MISFTLGRFTQYQIIGGCSGRFGDEILYISRPFSDCCPGNYSLDGLCNTDTVVLCEVCVRFLAVVKYISGFTV